MNGRRQERPAPELDAELAFHFTETVDALVARGWTEADASAEAERRFGSQRRYRRYLARIDRSISRRQAMRTLFSVDLRDAIRSLRAAPVVTLVAVASLALGIGANTALFSIANGLLFRPLPVHEPARLALVEDGSWSNPLWEEIRDRHRDVFDGAFAWSNERFDLSVSGETELVDGVYASGDMFEMLGIRPAPGRAFTPADDVRGGGPDGPVAVIGYNFWQRRFAGAPDVVGRQLTVNRLPVRIVGVAPRAFVGPEVGRAAQIFLPLAVEGAIRGRESSLSSRTGSWLQMMVRVPADRTFDAALAELNRRRPSIREATLPPGRTIEANANYLANEFKLVPSATGRSTLRRRFAEPLTIILIVAAGVLLIACANIANLMLARATARRHEMGLRLALGASRARLVRQLLTEGFLLVLMGTLAGLALARSGGALLVQQLGSAVNTVSIDLSIDWRVLGFAAAIALVTTLFFGLAPAAGLARVAPNEALKEQSRSITGDRRFGLRNGLVVAQVALSLVLVVGAGLFVRTFYSLMTTPLGFTAEDRLIVNVDVQRTAVPAADWLRLYERTAEAAAGAPGVRRVSASYTTPLSNRGQNDRVQLPDRPDLSPQQRVVFLNAIAPGWFETYGRRILAGRDLAVTDVAGAERATVVNQMFVHRFLGEQSPIGQTVKVGEGSRAASYVIVGLVNDALYTNLRTGVVPTMYVPLAQSGALSARFALTAEVTGDRGQVIDGLKAALAGTDPNLAFSFRDYGEQIAASVAQERLVAMLSGFFGALALLLSALGLYGVTTYSVNRRRSEIAVRLALGSDADRVVRLVLGRVAFLVAAGTAIGVGLSLWASKFIGTLLFRLEARDPATFAGAIAVLVAVGLASGWLPARRAARLDPTTVLRQ